MFVKFHRGRSITLSMRLCHSALLAAALLLGVPAAAQASTASVTTNVLYYAADNGEVNNVSLTFAAGTYTLTDPGATITPAAAP